MKKADQNPSAVEALLKRISAEDHSAPEVGYDAGREEWDLEWRDKDRIIAVSLKERYVVWAARMDEGTTGGSTIDGLMNALTRFDELAADETILT